MPVLFTTTFQGDPSVVGALDSATLQLAAREAFPLSPRRDALSNERYRSYKAAPLGHGRLLLSVVSNRRDVDRLGRSVLRANGCVLEASELVGAFRDLTAIWRALEAGADGFEDRVASTSVFTSPERFREMQAALRSDVAFYASAAAALAGERATFHFDGAGKELQQLQPVLSLLPAARLLQLHFATGGSDEETREPHIGVFEPDEDVPAERTGMFSNLLSRSRRTSRPVHVDFGGRRTRGLETPGPVALVEAIAAPSWPGIDDHARYRLFASAMDSAPRPLFEQHPALDEMRRAVRQAEQVSMLLESWR